MTVVFREEALADLDEIAHYIAQHNPAAADRVIARIREYAVPGLPYLVIYRPTTDLIDVIAIFHTSRDPGTKRQP